MSYVVGATYGHGRNEGSLLRSEIDEKTVNLDLREIDEMKIIEEKILINSETMNLIEE